MTSEQIKVIEDCEKELRNHFPDGVISVSTGVTGEWSEHYFGTPKVCFILAEMLVKTILSNIYKKDH